MKSLATTVFFANSGTCLLLASEYAFISPAEVHIRPVLYLIPGGALSLEPLAMNFDFKDNDLLILSSYVHSYLSRAESDGQC